MGSSNNHPQIQQALPNQEQLREEILQCIKLKRLHFSHQSNIFIKFQYLVRHFSQFELEQLLLDHNMIRTEVIELLAKIDLKQTKEKLKVICLSHNEIVCQSIKPIVNFDLIHLTTLYLGNDGCYYLTKPKLQSLQTLDLTSNAITEEGSRFLAMGNWPQLRTLLIYQTRMDDNILKFYIDEVFSYYDKDRSGTLDKRELVGFFNQLFQSFNDPRRIDQNTVDKMLVACDINRDGQVNKPELFTLFKRILMGDNTMYPNVPQQQYGGNQYQPYQGNQGNNFQNQYGQNKNPYQQYQNPNQNQPFQGNNSYPQNTQNFGNMGNQFGYANSNQYSQQQNPYGNSSNQYGYGSNQQTGPKYY